jgi:hypothetical protein
VTVGLEVDVGVKVGVGVSVAVAVAVEVGVGVLVCVGVGEAKSPARACAPEHPLRRIPLSPASSTAHLACLIVSRPPPFATRSIDSTGLPQF